jgi:hypothetical protein
MDLNSICIQIVTQQKNVSKSRNAKWTKSRLVKQEALARDLKTNLS